MTTKKQPTQNNALFRYSEFNDILELIKVIDDVEIETKEKSRNILLERIKQNQLISAILENKIIGFIGWSKNYNNNNQDWFIEQITIHKDYRRQGVGLNLLNYFLNVCKLEGINVVYATVQKHNEKSLNMFKKAGGDIIEKSEKENLIRISIK